MREDVWVEESESERAGVSVRRDIQTVSRILREGRVFEVLKFDERDESNLGEFWLQFCLFWFAVLV